jgi:hypothetical protein
MKLRSHPLEKPQRFLPLYIERRRQASDSLLHFGAH